MMRWQPRFADRSHAGQALGELLRERGYANRPDVLVLALPRGGVPVAYEVARALHVPMDVFIVRKLGLPGQEELAMGAIASGNVRVLNDDVIGMLRVPEAVIDRVTRIERDELVRREHDYRGDRPPPNVRGRTVIVIDDGLATGSTMRAAAAALRQEGPARIVVAVPVAAQDTCEVLRSEVDELICPMRPEPFHAVGLWYEEFPQTSDAEVRDLLERALRDTPAVRQAPEPPVSPWTEPRK